MAWLDTLLNISVFVFVGFMVYLLMSPAAIDAEGSEGSPGAQSGERN